MKKVLAIVLCAIICLSLCACEGEAAKKNEKTPGSSQQGGGVRPEFQTR